MPSPFANPILISPDASEARLDRLDLDGGSDSRSEDWLQDLLYRHPSALPISEIDGTFAGLIPIAREVSTRAGFIDVLYAAPTGRLAIVEAKLWRNPEARRKVVAQVLDYAKELARWTYDDLETAVRQARRNHSAPGQPEGLVDTIRAATGAFDEVRFHDEVARSLRRGEFLLLIVGDGIREGVGAITEFLEGHASLHFTFGLVEMAIFKTPDGGLLVQPRVLAQSTIARRIVVQLDAPNLIARDDMEGSATPEADVSPELVETREYFTKFWTEFLRDLRLDDQSQPVPAPTKGTNIWFYMPRASQSWVSAFIEKSAERVGVYLSLKSGPIGDRLYESLRQDREHIERALGVNVTWEDFDNGRHWIIARRSFPDVRSAAQRASIHAWLADVTNRFINVFRPRIEAFLREQQGVV